MELAGIGEEEGDMALYYNVMARSRSSSVGGGGGGGGVAMSAGRDILTTARDSVQDTSSVIVLFSEVPWCQANIRLLKVSSVISI